jgi:AcrR family transcriptional regulator
MPQGRAESRPELRGRGGRPSRQQSAQLADRILDVAENLFLGHGFGATSIEAVAKHAGISKRTFYHRFTGKERLFEAVVRRLMERWLPPFDTGLLSPPDIADALHRLVIHEAQRFPGLARILHEQGAASGIERIASHLEPRIASGELRPMDPRFAAEQFILSVVTGPQRRALGLGVPLTPAEIAAHAGNAVALFLDGARARAEADQ